MACPGSAMGGIAGSRKSSAKPNLKFQPPYVSETPVGGALTYGGCFHASFVSRGHRCAMTDTGDCLAVPVYWRKHTHRYRVGQLFSSKIVHKMIKWESPFIDRYGYAVL